MDILERVWFLVGLGIIFIILSTDPKSSISGTSNSQLSALFASASDSQNFLKQLNWGLITVFFILTLFLSL
jgi:protein translocase SecG subunit